MTDAFANQMRSPADPAISVFDITPDDAGDLPQVTTGLNVKTPGILRLTLADGSTGDISAYPGQTIPVRARRVWLTGTTATGISGLV